MEEAVEDFGEGLVGLEGQVIEREEEVIEPEENEELDKEPSSEVDGTCVI